MRALGAARTSIYSYMVPVLALVLGAVFSRESVVPLQNREGRRGLRRALPGAARRQRPLSSAEKGGTSIKKGVLSCDECPLFGAMPHSLDPGYLEHLTYSLSDASTLRSLGEFRGRQELCERQRPEVLTSMRQVARIESMESSNRLEGVLAARERVEQLALESEAPSSRSEQEIAGYRDALGLLHEAGRKAPFQVGVIRQLHSMLYKYEAGQGGDWKSVDNSIVERDSYGEVTRVRFLAVSAVETPAKMDDLVRRHGEAVEARQVDPLIAIPLTVLDFLCIHPFPDGNGRVARLITLQLLYQSSYDVGRYISLERIIEQSKETYYESLERSSHGWHESEHDVMPWLRYFWGVLLGAYKEFEERVGQVGGGRGSKSARVREAVARRSLPFAAAEIERDCPGVSRDTIRKVLRALRDEGAIESDGKGRGAKWRPRGR